MIELLDVSDHVVAFRISGILTAEGFDQVAEAVEAALDRHERIGLYGDMLGFSDMTGEAIAKDLQYGLSKIGELHRFRRSAVITDKQWMRVVVEFYDKFLPGVEVRAFGADEREAALQWVAEAA